jgi:hypothetical protein
MVEPNSGRDVRRVSSLRRIGWTLIVVGLLGFLGGQLPFAGTWANRVEFQVFFATTTIGSPDGGSLTISASYYSRVQRYGDDGRFRTGWFVKNGGGHLAIGLTANGEIVVYTENKFDHSSELFLFDLDGRLLGHRQAYFRLRHEIGVLTSALHQPTSRPGISVFSRRSWPDGRTLQ